MDDPVWLSRVQFALTIMFHYLFPPLTIGMGVVLVYLEGMFLRTRQAIYETSARFWTKVYALNFAMGVATGIVMEFQFGTNWAVYSRFVGDVFGSALAAEGIFAFFLESGFLAVLVFGWDRVGPKFHFFSTVMVALGSIFSSIWITVANSWQQTPAGHHVVNGRAEIVDFWAMVFNPSTVNRLVHVWLGAFILGGFFIMSISAWYVLENKHQEFARRSFTGALLLASLASCLQVVSGHSNAKMVAREQPAKLAAFEAHYETGPADLSLFGIPDERAGTLRANIAVPGLLSWLVHEDTRASIPGLDRFRPEDRPPVTVPFVSYHVMVALGMYFVALTLLALLLRWRGTLFQKRWLMWVFVLSVLGPFVANELGWVAAEVGRQPWIVHPTVTWTDAQHLALGADGFVRYDTTSALRTSEAVSASVRPEQVFGSIVLFSLIYLLLFAVWILVLNSKIQHGPEPVSMPASTRPGGAVAAAADRVDREASMTEAKERDR